MAKYSKRASEKVERAMHEKKRGQLKSGRSGKKVTSRKQAIAIGLSEARAEGAKVPTKKGTSKKSAGKKTTTKKGAAKKSTGRKSATKKSAGKRSAAGKSMRKRAAGKKSAATKTASKARRR